MKHLIILTWIMILAGCAQPILSSAPPAATPALSPTEPAAEDSSEAYTVDINPADFVDWVDNPYFPLIPGSKYVYENETEDGLERIEIEVLQETKDVMGITATVMRDTVSLEGELIEDTHDWFAQDKEGNVWYLGEDVSNYENGELIDKDGSWTAGLLLLALILFGLFVYANMSRSLTMAMNETLRLAAAQLAGEIDTRNGQIVSIDNFIEDSEYSELREQDLSMRILSPSGEDLRRADRRK